MEVSHDLKSVLVERVTLVEEIDGVFDLVDILRRDNAVHPKPQVGVLLTQRAQMLDRRTELRKRLVLAANRVVGCLEAVHRKVQGEGHRGVLPEERRANLLSSFEIPPIGRYGDRADAV